MDIAAHGVYHTRIENSLWICLNRTFLRVAETNSDRSGIDKFYEVH